MKQTLHISNHSLVEECRKGDKEALSLFYLRFAPRMLRVIRSYVHEEKDAEDILHDGFIIAVTRLDSLRDGEKVEVWLATIMKNLSLQFLKAQDVVQLLHEVPDVEDAPELDEFLDMAALELLIEKLPAGYQKVFRLAILENKSHKEIGKLLGIAPNSSSSQLFHAKLMMRKLIKEYKFQSGLGVLLIAALLWSLFIREPKNNLTENSEIIVASIDDKPMPTTVVSDSIINQKSLSVSVLLAQSKLPEPDKNIKEVNERRDSIVENTAELAETTDNVELKDSPINAIDERQKAVDDEKEIPYSPILRKRPGGGWSLKVGADPGLLSFNSTSKDLIMASPGGDNALNPEQPDEGDSDDNKLVSRAVGRVKEYRDYKNVNHTNSLPITVGLSVAKSINNLFGVETGVRYTYLHSRFETNTTQSDCHWHYIGIPLNLNMKIYSANRFRWYAGVGGAVDIPMYSNATVNNREQLPDLRPGRFNSPVVWSLSGNIGVSINISKRVDIFIQPTLQYHFDQSYTVPNVWTDNRWGFSLPFGVRFTMPAKNN